MIESDAAVSAPPSGRAPAMSPEDRRAQIIDATIPLLLARGAEVTSRQIAEAAGVAEGTVFRAFGDKDAVVQAAVAKYLDPEPLRSSLRAIDPTLPLDFKLRQVLSLLQHRFRGIFAIMAAAGMRGRPHAHRMGEGLDYAGIVAQLVAPDLDRLRVPPERVAAFLRLIAFASSIEQFHSAMPVELDELADIAVHGLVGTAPGDAAAPAPTASSKDKRC